ncbi:MAG: trypsin-like peptidase domain-containing protein [bacterium]|nr:trypsin-like peptidase domain-containing protein [bacterium]
MRYLLTILVLLLLGTAIYLQPKEGVSLKSPETEKMPDSPDPELAEGEEKNPSIPTKEGPTETTQEKSIPEPEKWQKKTEEPTDIPISQYPNISISQDINISKYNETTPTPAPKPPTLTPRPIDLRSVVGIYCDFENKNGETARYRGSGVVVREGSYSEGTYILTNRHVVDVQWTKWLTNDPDIDPGLKLTECKVHILRAEGKILPEEMYPYPYYDLRVTSGVQYDFKARLAYLPKTKGLSENEESELDYAILEVTGKNTSKYFEHENPRLPASPILAPTPKEWVEIIKDNRVVMPGYAFQEIGAGAFEEFRLLTKDGVVKDIYAGDEGLKGTPLTMLVEIPPDAYGGRSGSPIFYKGYLIGLVATKALPMPNSGNFQSPQPTISAILENMSTQANTKDIFQTITKFEK